MNIATNSPAVLLPAAQYNVFLWSYSCRGKNYFTEGVPLESLTVEAAQKVTKDFSVDGLMSGLLNRQVPHKIRRRNPANSRAVRQLT